MTGFRRLLHADPALVPSGAALAPSSPDTYLRVLESLDVGVVVQDRNLGIVFANAKATALLGITASEITARTTVDERWDVVGADG
mgnify:CR=1 FL=1